MSQATLNSLVNWRGSFNDSYLDLWCRKQIARIPIYFIALYNDRTISVVCFRKKLNMLHFLNVTVGSFDSFVIAQVLDRPLGTNSENSFRRFKIFKTKDEINTFDASFHIFILFRAKPCTSRPFQFKPIIIFILEYSICILSQLILFFFLLFFSMNTGTRIVVIHQITAVKVKRTLILFPECLNYRPIQSQPTRFVKSCKK